MRAIARYGSGSATTAGYGARSATATGRSSPASATSRTAAGRACLFPTAVNTVGLLTCARAATWSMVVAPYPWLRNRSCAASRTACRVAAACRSRSVEGDGQGDPDRIGLRRRVFLAPTQAEADDIVHAAPDSFIEGEQISDPAVRAMLTNREDIIVGTPAATAEILIEQARDLQVGNLLLWTDFRAFTGGHLDRCHELIGRDLVSALRKAAL